MKTAALIFTVLLSAALSAQAQKPTTGYAPVNGLRMYYEIHGSGSGESLVLLHGSFMTIPNNWTPWIGELSKTRKVIAVEMQGHGRTADINRDFSFENLADHIAAMLDYLKIKQAICSVTAWAAASQCRSPSVILEKCARLSVSLPSSATTAGSRRRSTRSRNSRRKRSKARPSKPTTKSSVRRPTSSRTSSSASSRWT